MSLRRIFLLIAGLGLFAAIGGGTWLWFRSGSEVPPRELTLYGNVEIREVELAFEVSGRVERELVDEGDRVDQGQLLATLEEARFKHELTRAQAKFESQRQLVAELEAGTRPENIRKARADVEAAEAKRFETKRRYTRVLELLPERAVAQQEADDAKAADDTAAANLRVAQAALDLALAGPRVETIAAAKAQRDMYQAEVDLANWSLGKTRLLSPCRGTIRQRILEPGDMASPDRPAYTVAVNDPLWVRVYASEPDLGKIQPGMKAEVRTDSFPDKRYEGWVGFVSPTAEFTPKTVQTEQLRTRLVYEVRVHVRNPNDELRLGMPVTVTIGLGSSGGGDMKPPTDAPPSDVSGEAGAASPSDSTTQPRVRSQPTSP
jgi:HlyD family secretion protein